MQDGVVSEITGAKASSSAMVREAGLMKERMVEEPTLIPSQDGKGGLSSMKEALKAGSPGAVCILVCVGSNTT